MIPEKNNSKNFQRLHLKKLDLEKPWLGMDWKNHFERTTIKNLKKTKSTKQLSHVNKKNDNEESNLLWKQLSLYLKIRLTKILRRKITRFFPSENSCSAWPIS